MEHANEITELKQTVTDLSTEVDRLNFLVKKYKMELYGSKSERFFDDTTQGVFEGLGLDVTPNQSETTIDIPGHTRKKNGRGKRKPFPDELPREEVIIDIPEDEKHCSIHNSPLSPIGYDCVEKLKTTPAQSVVVIEKRAKYSCPCCEGNIVQAVSPSVLPKTIATPELLSFIVFSKFFQGLPLYRVEELFKIQKIHLSRMVMASWLIRLTDQLQPIWNCLEEWAIDSGYMAIDATSIQVLKERGRKPQTKSSMWVKGSPELEIVLFEYNISGGGYVAKSLMSGFEGGLQADAHKGYGALDKANLILLGCMMHARRRFFKAWIKAKKKPGLARDALDMIKRLYSLEEALKKQELSPEERFRARLAEVKPQMEKIKDWAVAHKEKVLKSTELGNGIHYFINEYEELSAFLKNGRYEIDNGWVERVIKRYAIGRKAWLFSDTVAGARASALLYSLVITAKLNGKDPYIVMRDIFQKLPYAKSIEDYENLARLLLRSTSV